MSGDPFDWREYHLLAEELLKQPREAYLRSAVSRAYYFVFHLARQRLLSNGVPPVRRQYSHREVWDKFNTPDPRCRKLFETAKRLKEKRECADYQPHYAHIEKDAPAMVALAAQFATDLAQLDVNLPRKP